MGAEAPRIYVGSINDLPDMNLQFVIPGMEERVSIGIRALPVEGTLFEAGRLPSYDFVGTEAITQADLLLDGLQQARAERSGGNNGTKI
jgi:hypothetical protein